MCLSGPVQILCFLIDLQYDFSVLYCKWDIEAPHYYYTVCFYFLNCVCFIYLGFGVYVYNCFLFLLNWPFNHYIMSFFVFYDSFNLNSVLSDIIQPSLLSFGYNIHGIFFHSIVYMCPNVYRESLVEAQSWILFFLAHSGTLYLLIKEFNPFTFELLMGKDFHHLFSVCPIAFFVPYFLYYCFPLCSVNFLQQQI